MSSKIRDLPKNIQCNHGLIKEALSKGCVKAKIINTTSIALGNWIRVQCQYGCSHFGKRLTCPPFTPMVDEVSDMLADYQNAVLIEAERPENVHGIVLSLGETLKGKGYQKAFALGSMVCNLCETCKIESYCELPAKARPSMRAFGIDVSTTALNNGWKSEFSPEYCERNLIGMVLIN